MLNKDIFEMTAQELIENDLDMEWMKEVDIYSEELNEAWDELDD